MGTLGGSLRMNRRATMRNDSSPTKLPDDRIPGSQDFDRVSAITMSRNNTVGPQVRERLPRQPYEGVAIETGDALVDASHGVVLRLASWQKAVVDASSEQ